MVFFPSLTIFQTRFQNDYNEQYALYLITRSLIKYSCSKYVHLRKVRFGFFFFFFRWRIDEYSDTPITSTIFTLPTSDRHNQKLCYSKQNWRNVCVSDLFGWTSWKFQLGTFVTTKSRVHRLKYFFSFWIQTFWSGFLKLVLLNNFIAI